MTKTQERIYLTLWWWYKCFGYPPALNELAEKARVDQTTIKDHLKTLAKAGYIELAFLTDGSYTVKFLIEPRREWAVNIKVNPMGRITDVISEIPVVIYVHDGHIEPLVYHSRKTLDKAELIKKGLMV